MKKAELKFADDQQFLAYLNSLNPKVHDGPPGFNWREAETRGREIYERFRAEFGDGVLCDGDVQDTTYHTGISIPGGEIRLSNFDQLATIAGEECVQEDILSKAIQILEESGKTYVPFRLFGEPFSKRERFNGDLFCQLFDYI